MSPELTAVAAIADRIGSGAVFILIGLGVALYKRMLVFGWLHADCEEELRTCRALAGERAIKIESELDALRRQRSAHDATAS
jgi:hypothetical protein